MNYYCKTCRKQLSKYDLFCPNCGRKNEELEKTDTVKFWLPLLLMAISYVISIILHIVSGILHVKYLTDPETINWYFTPQTIIKKFLINYLVLSFITFLYIFNKKKQKQRITFLNNKLVSIFILLNILTIILVLLENFFVGVDFKILTLLSYIIPFWNFGNQLYWFVDGFSFIYWFDWIAFFNIITGIVYFFALALLFKNIKQSMSKFTILK